MKDEPSMSFREKSAWISFVSILGVSIPFFWNSYRQFTGRIDSHSAVGTAFGLLLLLVVLSIVLHLAIAIQSPRDAKTPKDERERSIDMRATRAAYYVLLVGAFAAVGAVHLRNSGWVIQQVVLLAIVVAELVRFGGQIVRYRRDA